jgi:hypothetical protein
MINHDKITATKVAQRLSGHIYGDVHMTEDMSKFVGSDMQHRMEENELTDDAGRLWLSCHHLKNALDKIDRYADKINYPKPEVVLGGNNTLDFKFMCKHFKNDIDTRIIPALLGLKEFSIPANEAVLEYEKIIAKYERKINAIKLMFPSGKGRYKNSYKALMPHFKEVLSDLSAFTKRAIADYSLEMS